MRCPTLRSRGRYAIEPLRAPHLERWARTEDELTQQRQMTARNFLRLYLAYIECDIES